MRSLLLHRQKDRPKDGRTDTAESEGDGDAGRGESREARRREDVLNIQKEIIETSNFDSINSFTGKEETREGREEKRQQDAGEEGRERESERGGGLAGGDSGVCGSDVCLT